MMTRENSLVERSAVELRQLIDDREISPVELLEACIERIETLNPLVNAVAAKNYADARLQAQRAEQAVLRGDQVGLLHGLPIGVKDLEPTAGLLTTFGSPLYRDHVPASDVELVARLRRAGAIVTAKTNVPELGAGANTRNPVWGATGNPFNPNLNAGGSSGGSAAALACDMLPLCTGSDTGGSLRIPASLCGVVGFRPSPGLVPSVRKLLGFTPISVVGPMGRSVDDACLQLAAIAGMDPGDPLSYPVDPLDFLKPPMADLGGLRVAYSADLGCCAVDPEIRRTFESKLQVMRGFFKVCEPIDLDLGDVHQCFDVMRAESFLAGKKEAYDRDPTQLGPNSLSNYQMGLRMSLVDAAWAHSEQTRIVRRFQQVFKQYDLLLTPTTPLSPFPWMQPYGAVIDGKKQENYYRWLALTYAVTLTTHPAISIPCGTDRIGMPFGMQVVGRFRGDAALLSAARSLERSLNRTPDLRRPRPNLAGLVPAEPALTSIVTHPVTTGATATQARPGQVVISVV